MPRTKEQFQKMRDARKERILLESAKAFAIEGYDSVTVDKIVEKAKCSHGLFYHYFKNKEDIYKALLARLTLDKFDKYQESLNCLEPIDALRKSLTLDKIENVIKELEFVPVDLLTVELTQALENIRDILGHKAKLNMVDEIFSRFCLGK